LAVYAVSATFKRIVRGIGDDKKLEPLLVNALYDPNFKPFTVHVRGAKGATRKPDGWFHPSKHTVWPERQLYYYLLASQDPGIELMEELMDPTGVMAVTAGTFWHEFVGQVLLDAKVLRATEVKVKDELVGSRGSMDGVLVFEEAWEFKTVNGMRLNRLEKGSPGSPAVVESFRKMWPQYYGQAQEYMRMSGYRTMRFTLLEPVYPFAMRELAVPYNEPEAMSVRNKFMRARQAVADQRLPDPCCGPGSKESRACFARGICPIGLMTSKAAA
jgi:hypothetical protein